VEVAIITTPAAATPIKNVKSKCVGEVKGQCPKAVCGLSCTVNQNYGWTITNLVIPN
jgi:hypothetical protein